MPLAINAQAIPTGGVINVSTASSTTGQVTLGRATSGSGGLSSFQTIYSGAVIDLFMDVGDGTPGPLDPTQFYVYEYTDTTGSVRTQAIQPAWNVDIEVVEYTRMVIALLQGAVNAANMPPGFKPARVFAAMPLAGQPPLPLISVCPDLVQQVFIPVGVDDERVGDFIQPAKTNDYTQTGTEKHMFRISVFSFSAEERDYYRNFVIAVMRVSAAYALSAIGADLVHSYQAVSYQEADQPQGTVPGFYGSDILYEFEAMANIRIRTNYPLIETITTTSSGLFGNIHYAGSVPVSGAEPFPPILIQTEVPIEEP